MSTIRIISICLVLLLSIVPSYFFYQTILCFAPVKENRVIKLINYIVIFFIMTTTIYPKDPVNLPIILGLFILTMLLGFQGNLQRKLAAVSILLPLVVSTNFLFEDFGLQLFLLAGKAEIIDATLHAFFGLLKIPLWYGIRRLFQKRITDAKKFMKPAMWAMINLISLGPLIGMIFILIFSPDNHLLIFPAMLAIALTSIGIQYLTGYLTESVKKEQENRNLKLQEDYYLELEKSQLEVRKLKHDLNNHLSVVGNYLESDHVAEAKNYFTGLTNVYGNQSRTFSKNPLVNNVLNSKYQLAQENDIDCFFNIDISDWVGIDDVSLCTILANTLDNAIEAAAKIPEVDRRKLSVKARYYKSYFSYEIANSTEELLVTNDGKIITTKPDKKNHGFGLANVREIVENYAGTMEIKQTDDEFLLLIVIAEV